MYNGWQFDGFILAYLLSIREDAMRRQDYNDGLIRLFNEYGAFEGRTDQLDGHELSVLEKIAKKE